MISVTNNSIVLTWPSKNENPFLDISVCISNVFLSIEKSQAGDRRQDTGFLMMNDYIFLDLISACCISVERFDCLPKNYFSSEMLWLVG